MNELLIRADATTAIGIGHVMRCLALAQAWQERGGKATFLGRCESDLLARRIVQEGFDFVPLTGEQYPSPGDREQTIALLTRRETPRGEGGTWVALDGYHFDATYQKSIKDAGYKLLWIDDYGHADHYYADVVLNQNISADAGRYANREAYTRLLLGSSYILLRREFRSWRETARSTAPAARKVLVTMGGSDPGNTTVKVLRALREVAVDDLEVAVVVGPANPHRREVEDEIGRAPYRVQSLPPVQSMPARMSWADIAVSAGGSTCWELAFMGLPHIIVISSDNQQPIAEGLDAAGAAINLGWQQHVAPQHIAHAIRDLLSHPQQRDEMRAAGRRLVDGLGLQRLLTVCEELA